MSPRLPVAAALLAAICQLPLLGQARTWIVDVNNGPGTNFTVLQTAFDTVAEGDTLVVRRGTYAPCTTSKALTVLGEGGVAIVASQPNPPAGLAISSIAAN